jgi:hypothetical protein
VRVKRRAIGGVETALVAVEIRDDRLIAIA